MFNKRNTSNNIPKDVNKSNTPSNAVNQVSTPVSESMDIDPVDNVEVAPEIEMAVDTNIYKDEFDLAIKDSEVPERLNLKILNFQRLGYDIFSEDNLKNGTKWILQQLEKKGQTIKNSNSATEIIYSLLNLHTKSNMDIPYIAQYKKSEYYKEFSEEQIWTIYEIFYDWITLMDKKLNLKNSLITLKDILKDDNQISYNISRIDECSCLYELHYFEEFLIFIDEVYRKGQIESSSNIGSCYKILQCARYFKLDEFAQKFSLSQVDLETNLEKIVHSDNTDNNIELDIKPPTNPKIKPAQMAFDYVKDDLNEEIKILTFTCKFMAIQISSFPFISLLFRDYIYEYATLTTTPTDEGLKELDVTHPSFRVKRITNKPLNSFNDDLFTDIYLSEKSNLITVKIELDKEKELILKDIFRKAFLNNSIDKKNVLNNEWNTVREEVLRMLIDECVLPKQIADIKRFLKHKAEDVIIEKCRDEFKKIISVKPLSNHFENKASLISFVYEKSKDTAHYSILNSNGEVIETNSLQKVIIKSIRNITIEDKKIFYENRSKCKELFIKNTFDIVLITCNTIDAKYLKDLLEELISESQLEVPIIYCNQFIPNLAVHSQFAKKYLSNQNYDLNIKASILMGRLKQNALAEISNLWNEDIDKNYLLLLDLHKYQYSIQNKLKLASVLENEIIKLINSNGINFMQAVQHYHLRNQLSFVSGLGPRKAVKLINDTLLSLKKQKIKSRNDLKDKNVIKNKNDFLNCAGFLNFLPEFTDVDMHELHLNTWNLLDLTRIHPSMYDLTYMIIQNNSKDINVKEVLKRVIIFRNNLELNEDFIKSFIEDQKAIGLLETQFNIEIIIQELRKPIHEIITSEQQTQEEILNLMTNENGCEHKIGHIIYLKVIRVENENIVCKYRDEFDIDVPMTSIFEGREEYKLILQNKVIKPNTDLFARISYINYDRFKIDVSARYKDLINHKPFMSSFNFNTDAFEFPVEEDDYVNHKYIEETKLKNYFVKSIKCNEFHNYSLNDALDDLNNKDLGSCLFRPSYLGFNFITLTWKFYHNVYAHIDIAVEELGSKGVKLKIENEIYKSFKDIITKYVEPCNNFVKECISHRKFYPVERLASLEVKLIEEKRNNPKMIQYNITILTDYPQHILLVYIPYDKVLKELIFVNNKGLTFHEQTFINLDDLLNFFKEKFYTNDYYKAAKKEELKKFKKRSVLELNYEQVLINEEDTYVENEETLKELKDLKIHEKQDNKMDIDSKHNGHVKTNTNNTNNINKSTTSNSEFSRPNTNSKQSVEVNEGTWGEPTAVDNKPQKNAMVVDSWGTEDTTVTNTATVSSSDWGTTTTTTTTNNNSNWGSSSNNNQSKGNSDWGTGSSNTGNNGGGSGITCNYCKESGHMIKDCPKKKPRDGPNKCYNCDKEGHMGRDCPEPKKPRSNKCFNCNEEGHSKNDCPNPKVMKCFNCNETGHSKLDCPNPKAPYTGPKREGGGGGERKPMICFNCYQEGHGKSNCTNEKVFKCYNCDEIGHGGKECTKPKRPRDPNSSFGGNRNSNSNSGGGGGGAWGNSNSNTNNNSSSNSGWGEPTSNKSGGNDDGWGNSSKPNNTESSNDGGWGTSDTTNTKKDDNEGGWGNDDKTTTQTAPVKQTTNDDNGW